MDLDELKKIWSDHDKKLDKSLNFNRLLLMKINLDKSRSTLNKLLWMRVLEAFAFLVLLVLLGRFIAINFSATAPVFSAIVLDIFAIIGFAGSIKQIVLIKQVDFAGSIISIQKQLEKIKLHSLQIFKLLILSAPFYMTYAFLGFKVLFDFDLYSHMKQEDINANIFAAIITAIPTLWFYSKLNVKNSNNRWIKKIIDVMGGKQVTSAMEFLNEVKEFETED